MVLSEIIAICGFDCRKCPAYKATHSNDKAEMERVAAEWSKVAGKKMSVKDILCDGCRVPGGRRVVYCASCNIKTCAEEREYITCAHCPECPCDKIIQRKTREMLEALKKTLLNK
jgi:hypothetical protein